MQEETIEVRHANWTDRLVFEGESFIRLGNRNRGRVEPLPDGSRLLKWARWPSEVLTNDHRLIGWAEHERHQSCGQETLEARWPLPACDAVKVCVMSCSRMRLNYVCALIGCMRNQREKDFVHILHLIDYTGDQMEFIRSMVDGDPRFVLRECWPMGQKPQFRRLLWDAGRIEASRYVKVDDDDLYAPGFLETTLSEAENHDMTCCRSLLVHHAGSNRSQVTKSGRLFGNNMCFSRKALDFLQAAPDESRYLYEDSQSHGQLLESGHEVRIFEQDFPQVLYLRHGSNVS